MRIFLALQIGTVSIPMTHLFHTRATGGNLHHRQAAKEFLVENHHLISDYHQQIQVANELS